MSGDETFCRGCQKLGWNVPIQVMRRTHASIMKELDIDPKWVADQLGHSLDVSQNVYTQISVEQRLEAVQQLELALVT
jgi:integrase